MFVIHYITPKFLHLHYNNGFYTNYPERGEPIHSVQKGPSIKSRKARTCLGGFSPSEILTVLFLPTHLFQHSNYSHWHTSDITLSRVTSRYF